MKQVKTRTIMSGRKLSQNEKIKFNGKDYLVVSQSEKPDNTAYFKNVYETIIIEINLIKD